MENQFTYAKILSERTRRGHNFFKFAFLMHPGLTLFSWELNIFKQVHQVFIINLLLFYTKVYSIIIQSATKTCVVAKFKNSQISLLVSTYPPSRCRSASNKSNLTITSFMYLRLPSRAHSSHHIARAFRYNISLLHHKY